MFLPLILIATSPVTGVSWAGKAERDLMAIHDTLEENHPGPVDPLNPAYRVILETALRPALNRARSAHSYREYNLSLLQYTNAFRDGHTGIVRTRLNETVRWPGFVVQSDHEGGAVVAFADTDSGVVPGARLLGCDGRTLKTLMVRRIEPFFWNRDIPQARMLSVGKLFDPDVAPPPAECTFSTGRVRLRWRRTNFSNYSERLAAAFSAGERPSLTFKGDTWFVRLPSFYTPSEETIARMKALITDLDKHRAELRTSRVVFDVRGNDGGDSSWGEEVVKVVWGDLLTRHAEDLFDATVDWRTSPLNLQHIQQALGRVAPEDPDYPYWRAVNGLMLKAIGDGHALARQSDDAVAHPAPVGPAPIDPVAGPVFLLTDEICKSACLDFADLILSLPRVTLIGLPTSADTLYLDVNSRVLPSGLARVVYAMKVYRHRSRGSNRWYEPKWRWPGGPMTDQTIEKWVAGLPQPKL